MLRTRLVAVLVALGAAVAPVGSGAAADDGDARAEGGAALDAARERVEAFYRKAAAQHGALRAFADSLRDREPGAWPEPIAAEPARAAVEAFVDLAPEPPLLPTE